MQAPVNMSLVSVTEDVSKFDMSWLKEMAFWNMLCISVTEDVSKFDISWLKAKAL